MAHALLRVAAVLHDVLVRNLDGEDVIFHVLRRDALLKVRLDLALVARVGVDDVPVAGGHVELATQLGDRFLFRRGRGCFFGGAILGGLVLGGLLLGSLNLSGGVGGGLFGGRRGGVQLGFDGQVFGVLVVTHDYSSWKWGRTVEETRLQVPAGGFVGLSRRSMHLAYRIRSRVGQRKA